MLADIAIATGIILVGGVRRRAVPCQPSVRGAARERAAHRGASYRERPDRAAVAAPDRVSPCGLDLHRASVRARARPRLSPVRRPAVPGAVAIVLVAWGGANLFSRLIRGYGRGSSSRLPRARAIHRMADLVALAVRYPGLVHRDPLPPDLPRYLDHPAPRGSRNRRHRDRTRRPGPPLEPLRRRDHPARQTARRGRQGRIDPYIGTVTALGLRSTRIRTLDGLWPPSRTRG